MQLRYGFNEIDAWWHVGIGEHRDKIRRQLKLMNTPRSCASSCSTSPCCRTRCVEWHLFAAYVQAVLDAVHCR